MSREPVVIGLLALVPLTWALMRLGWQRRTARQSDVPQPPAAPEALARRGDGGEGGVDGYEATYVSTTSAADWLDRITVHGLGVRSGARVLVDPAGVLVARSGAPDVFVPAGSLHDVRRESVRAGKAVSGGGLVVLEWSLGDRRVATALHVRHDAERAALLEAAHALLDPSTGPDARSAT